MAVMCFLVANNLGRLLCYQVCGRLLHGEDASCRLNSTLVGKTYLVNFRHQNKEKNTDTLIIQG